ncbi:MAG: hypothetical protein M3Y80_00160 [Verrucomicrobiota bacterium]|nr:hypothetical protein [Verrucomicrobiota bacterium]
MPAADSLRALLTGAVDYAGLFPPASLSIEPALANQGRYVRDPEQWMLGTFVLPVGKFEAAADHLKPFDVKHRLRLSALGAKTESASEFTAALRKTSDAIHEFEMRHGGTASATQIEMAIPAHSGATITEAAEALSQRQMPTFWEAPTDEAERVIGLIADHHGESGVRHFGFKLRTGGVIASAFPSSIQIARALIAATTQRVAIKFTAGLHHPVRQFHQSVQTKMHGFLNVLGAGVLAAEHEWTVQQTAAMLDEEDAETFAFDDGSFRWRHWEVATPQIKAHREIITSFGSCSFDEPPADLRALGML